MTTQLIHDLNSIPLVSNALYILDIDETVIYYESSMFTEYKEEIELFERTMSRDCAFENANQKWESLVHINEAKPIDEKGLNALKEFSDANKSIIVFLTARFENIRDVTLSQLKRLFPWVENHMLHMASGSPKGEKMEKMFLTHHHLIRDNIVFVDDKQYNIDSVIQKFPHVKSFLIQA